MSGDPGRHGLPPGDSSPAGGTAARAAPPGADGSPLLEQPFSSDSLYALRAAVAAHAAQAGVPAGQVPDLVIAVHELATNAIRHGAGHGRLRIWAGGGALHCEVSDDGVASPARSATAPAGPATAPADAAAAQAAPAAAPADAAAVPADPVASAPGGARGLGGTGVAASWLAAHGHGLWLVCQVADETAVHSGPSGTVATVSFTLPAARAEPVRRR